MIKHHDQRQVGEKSFYFILHFFKSITEDRNLETVTEAETMEKHCWLACSRWLALPVFSDTPGPLAMVYNQSGRAFPTSTTNQENSSGSCLQTNLMEAFYQWRLPFAVSVEVCVKLTKPSQDDPQSHFYSKWSLSLIDRCSCHIRLLHCYHLWMLVPAALSQMHRIFMSHLI